MKAVLLDRDGVINEDRRDYVKNISEFVILPGVPEAIGELTRNGFAVFVLSNQAGISKGLYSSETLRDIDSCLQREVEKKGGKIAKTYYCPHQDEDNCSCRKPKSGMILVAAQEHQIDIANSFLIGDRWKDIAAGQSAGCKTIWLDKKYSENYSAEPADFVTDNLFNATQWILQHEEMTN